MSAAPIKPRDRRPLRDAWFGPLSLSDLCRRSCYSRSAIQRFWVAERLAGRLPSFPVCRPHFAGNSPRVRMAVPAAAPEPTEVDSETYAIDPEAERIFAKAAADDDDMRTCAVPRVDPLLAALERRHGADLHRYEADEAQLDDRRAPSRSAALLTEIRRHDAARLNEGGVACPA